VCHPPHILLVVFPGEAGIATTEITVAVIGRPETITIRVLALARAAGFEYGSDLKLGE